MYKGLDMSNKKCKHFSLSNVSESPDIYVEYLGTRPLLYMYRTLVIRTVDIC